MQIRKARQEDLVTWVQLRHDLWPDEGIDALTAGAKAILESREEVCFLAMDDSAEVVGFIEGAVHVGPNGPYAHVEGWYVVPELREQGRGRELMGQLEQWCLHRAIGLLTSDTTALYPNSPAAHAGCGFRQIHELKIFLKELRPPGED